MCRLAVLIALLALSGCANKTPGESSSSPPPPPVTKASKPVKVLMIIAHKDFRDEEFAKPKQLLEEAGHTVVVASSRPGTATGMLGMRVPVDMTLKEVNPDEFGAIVFVGGTGAQEFWHDATAQEIAREAAAKGKVLGAICLAPVTLANAGVLKGKRATVWATEKDRLKAEGAVYTGADVEADGRIITASGPEAAEQFGRRLLKALEEQEH